MTIHSVVIQKLLSTNAHIGHRMRDICFKEFTYGFRNGFTVIDSDKTLICLRTACRFMGLLAREKGDFMFINTNPLHDEIIAQMRKKIGHTFGNCPRIPGFLTNHLSSKKVYLDERDKHKPKFLFGLSKLPDCLVIVDSCRKSIYKEAFLKRIPVVSVVHPSMPKGLLQHITYPIPANPSVQFVYMFCNLMTKTLLLEQKHSGIFPIPENQADKPECKTYDINRDVLVVPYQNLVSLSSDPGITKKILDKLVVLKLECLGTKMGFNGPKSTVKIRSEVSCLDLIIDQIQSLNSKYGCRVPLFVTTTVKTHYDILTIVDKHSKANIDIHALCQTYPEVNAFDRQNMSMGGQYPNVKGLEGMNSKNTRCEFDRGRMLLSLLSSEASKTLFMQGKDYILVLCGDNMAASVDPKILNYLIEKNIECCMEVIPTRFSRQGQFETANLSEIAQFSDQHPMDNFSFIDTQNLWLSISALEDHFDISTLGSENNPMDDNRAMEKMKDSEKKLFQETAVGSALRFFDDAIGIDVPRARYFPLKSTSDLLLAQSDLYCFTDGLLVRNKARCASSDPSILLGPEFEKLHDFLSRFKSIPSIIELESLEVTGDVWFGAGITLKGQVVIAAKSYVTIKIPDGATLDNMVIDRPGLI